jgi:uncharacterized protein (DUF1800 family)
MAKLLDRHDSAGSGWTAREATHLLWRCAGGACATEIAGAVEDGLEKTVARLIATQPEKKEFLEGDSLLHGSALKSGNIKSLKRWWLYRLATSANPLAEKMTLFWHNHFATSNAKVRSTGKMDVQHALLRKHALGNFASLFRGMARDVAMLIWLDGNANRKRHPNENFAREVMELFSLGIGNYTERDIKEAARAFTGWHVRNEEFWFNKVQHDPGVKKVLGKAGKFRGDDILEICLQQPACARFLASKLLAAFVRPDADSALVEALAARIRTHKYEIAPVLQELLSSRVFYAPESRRSLIKSPVELVVGTARSLESTPHLDDSIQLMSDLGQNLFEPPTVKGWEGGRRWINSATMLQRANFATRATSTDRLGSVRSEGVDHYIDLLLGGEVSKGARRELHAYQDNKSGKAPANGLIQLIMTMPEYQLI